MAIVDAIVVYIVITSQWKAEHIFEAKSEAAIKRRDTQRSRLRSHSSSIDQDLNKALLPTGLDNQDQLNQANQRVNSSA